MILWLISRAKFIDRILLKITERFLKKWTKLHTYDYDSLLNLSGDYEVITIKIKRDSWLSERELAEVRGETCRPAARAAPGARRIKRRSDAGSRPKRKKAAGYLGEYDHFIAKIPF